MVTGTKSLEESTSTLHSCYSKCAGELVKNAESQALPQPHLIIICILERFPPLQRPDAHPPGDAYAY